MAVENRRSLDYHSKWQYDMAEVELFDWSYSEPVKKCMVLKHMTQNNLQIVYMQNQCNRIQKQRKLKNSLKMGDFYMWFVLIQMCDFNIVNICCDGSQRRCGNIYRSWTPT